MGTLFAGGSVINASGTVRADVLIEGEHIALIAPTIAREGHRVIDVSGKYLMPGGVDVHTHFDLPVSGTVASDDFTTGGRAAAFGGTTTHIDFAIQTRGQSLRQALDEWKGKAEGKATIDYGLHMTIVDLRDEVAAEIPAMAEAGVPSLKLLMAYKGGVMVDDTTMFRVMQMAAKHGMLVMVHAENGDVIADLQAQLLRENKTDPMYHPRSRPAALEAEATNRAITLAEVAGCDLYIVHMTCEGAVEALRRGRARGLPVMGETCVQYLFLTADDLARPGHEGAKFVCSPPLRTIADQNALWNALRDRTLQVISTDHCPFWYEGGVKGRPAGKELGRGNFTRIPNGLPAVEDRLKMVWHFGVNAGRMDANRFVEVMCTNPARAFGLYPRKGEIAVGADADIVVWDPNRLERISAVSHHMAVDYNVFEGRVVRGGPIMVYLRGAPIVDGDRWLGAPGSGQFLKRGVRAPVL
ncbi:MAG: dihydropyrimidinase [Anaerolineae bacterium]|nr:dihydropyrimidinase [Anaerolineae bacterium]